jgi:DNA replicative helicase MCM subunit Mcm2 (Cdc46/Mcm family)
MHREKDTGSIIKYSPKSLRFYINAAKKLKPMLTNEAAKALRRCYLKIRNTAK